MRKPPSSKPAPTLLQDIEAALAQDLRPEARQRLQAVKMRAQGKPPDHAAKAVNGSKESVLRWTRIARNSGCAALLIRRHPGRKPLTFTPSELKTAREQIKAALEKRPDWQSRARLLAVDAVLTGATPERMAEAERVTVHTVKLWISVVKNKGALALMRNTKPYVALHARNLDAKALRELAAREPDRKVAFRLRAIADVAGGLGFLDVGARLRISGSTVANWLDQFNEGGLEALRSKRVR